MTEADPTALARAPARARLALAAPALLLALLAAVYAPALGFGSVRWDDDLLVFENPAVRALARGDPTAHRSLWMPFAPRERFGKQFQPLSDLSYALDGALFGFEDARPFHLQGVLWHALAALALFSLARALLVSRRAALLAAALFAAHPANVEAVAWISGRRTAISGALVLLCARAWLAYRSGPTALGPRQAALLGATIALALLASLAKQTGLAIPLVLLAIELCMGPGRATVPGERRERRWLALIPHAALGLAFAALFYEVGRRESVILAAPPPLSARAAMALESVATSARIAVLPLDLHAVYARRVPDPGTLPPLAAAGALIVLGALAAAILLARRAPAAAAGILGAGACLLPALTGLGTQVVAERYLYLPLAFAALAAGAGWRFLNERSFTKSAAADAPSGAAAPASPPVAPRPPLPAALAALAALAVLALAAAAHLQVRAWRDDVTLWERCVAIEPEGRIGRRLLGRAYLRRDAPGDAARAEEHLRAAARLERASPGVAGPAQLPWVMADLALLAERRGAPEEAEALLVAAATEAAPGSERAMVNLGDFYRRRGERAKARAVYEACVERDPGAAVARGRLGEVEGEGR